MDELVARVRARSRFAVVSIAALGIVDLGGWSLGAVDPRFISPGYTLCALLQMVSGFAFLLWLHAAISFARKYGPETKIVPTPGRAIAAYFIPVISLFRPYQDMQRIAAASDPSDLELPTEVREKRVGYRGTALETVVAAPWTTRPPLLIWWATYLGSIVVSLPVFGVASLIVHGVALGAAAALWLWVVRAVTTNQTERARRIRLRAESGMTGVVVTPGDAIP